MPNGIALIERREYKYLTDENTAHRIREAIQPFCLLDAHAARHPTGRYVINSLYFDTPRLSLYLANERELVDRFKLRVRFYPPSGEPVFLEVKRRVNDVVLPGIQGVSLLLQEPTVEI